MTSMLLRSVGAAGLVLSLLVIACEVGAAQEANAKTTWKVPFAIDIDEQGSPANFLLKDGFTQCGDDNFVIVSGKGKRARAYDKAGKVVTTIDLAPITRGIADIARLEVVCSAHTAKRIGFTIYSGDDDSSPEPSSPIKTAVIFDRELKRWSAFFPMSQAVAGDTDLYVVSELKALYALDRDLAAKVLARIDSPFQRQSRRPLAETISLPGERLHFSVPGEELLCVISEEINCASLEPLRREVEKRDLINVSFGPIFGRSIYVYAHDRALACNLENLLCVVRLQCECEGRPFPRSTDIKSYPGIQYAAGGDGRIYELRVYDGPYVPAGYFPIEDLQVRADNGTIVYSGVRDLMQKAEYASIAILGNEVFLLLSVVEKEIRELNFIRIR